MDVDEEEMPRITRPVRASCNQETAFTLSDCSVCEYRPGPLEAVIGFGKMQDLALALMYNCPVRIVLNLFQGWSAKK
ncbi:hypothetical protein CRI94_07400 [Longibacter salinarum]|uniref:Uncharacterized protein n=1 Tax=Longibacter salinarum TaxID=1850348 RepID=A0A2A8CYZ5_9BACT|nr:hypothetical protein CRI94_07400 [Longibacter salinarum]